MDSPFEFACRVCLVDSSPDMRPLSDKRTRDILFECTNVLVEPEDEYPQQMCSNCWSRCQNWCGLKELAQESDRRLRLRKEEELMGNSCKIEVVQGELLDDVDISIVKEEPLEYLLEGYSLAPKEEVQEEEDDPLNLYAENPQLVKMETTILPDLEPNNGREENLKCGYCPKSFRNLSDRKRHELVHSDERPFPCDECGRGFKRRETLNRHVFLVHTGVKELECDQCEKKFNSKYNLEQHTLTHAGIKAFECDLCGKKFIHNTTLISHKRTHSQMRPYKCSVCHYTFKHKRNLDRHLKNIHK